MSLFFVAGSAGLGKTSTCRILKARGYEAYDVDEDGFARWINQETGFVHPKSSIGSTDRTPDFLAIHEWQVPIAEIQKLRQQTAGRLAFLFGDIRNEAELRDLFDGMAALYADDETIKHRLATRTDNDWGKQPHELQRTLDLHHVIYDQYRNMGATMIDATQSPEQVADAIINWAKEI